MSRRCLFLIVAGVVMLYFSVILVMLHPLHTRGYMHRFAFKQVPNLHWCKELRWRSPPAQHVAALVSYPGSGNTWLRYLLQQATGIVTGSIYMDHGLRLHGFPAENVTDGSVLVVKTHEPPPLDGKFKSAILLIRNPRDAILADFNRLHKGHIGTAPKSAFLKKAQDKKMTDWARYVSRQLVVWEALHRAWLSRSAGALHVVFYETLVRDARAVMRGVLRFLRQRVAEADLDCALANREGIYRRRNKHQDFDPFTVEMNRALHGARGRVVSMVADYMRGYNETDWE